MTSRTDKEALKDIRLELVPNEIINFLGRQRIVSMRYVSTQSSTLEQGGGDD